MSVSVRYMYDDHLLLGTGEKVPVDDFGFFGAPVAVAHAVSLPRLRQALRMHARVWDEPECKFWLSDDPPERFNDETSPRLPYQLSLRENELVLEVDVWSADRLPPDNELASGARPLLDRWGGEVLGFEEAHVDHGHGRTLVVCWPISRRTVADAIELGEQLFNLADLIVRGGLDRAAARHLLEGRLWKLFIGADENEWLEAKSQHYGRGAREEFSFASDIAALCNSAGGMLIVGMKTKRHPEGDRITSINRCPLRPGTLRRYENLLRRLVFPSPVGVRIDALPDPAAPGEGLLVIDVAQQPARLQPFIVRGAMLGDSVHGALIGIPVRRGAATDWLDAAALHARLRAGSTALGDYPR